MSKKASLNDPKFLDKVLERALDESSEQKQKKEIEAHERATIESIQEVTGLSKQKVQEIIKDLEKEEDQKKKGRARGVSVFIKGLAYLMVSVVLFGGIFLYVTNNEGQTKSETSHSAQGDKLLEAIRKYNLELVKHLVEKEGVSVKTNGRYSPMVVAFSTQNSQMIQYLKSKGAEVLPASIELQKKIILSAQRSNRLIQLMVMDAFIKKFPETNAFGLLKRAGYFVGEVGLTKAFEDKNTLAIQQFASLPSDPLMEKRYLYFLNRHLHKKIDHKTFRVFLDAHKEKLSEEFWKGAFLLGIRYQDVDYLKLLVDNGAPVNWQQGKVIQDVLRKIKTGTSKYLSPLNYAIKRKETEYIQYLLDIGANPNVDYAPALAYLVARTNKFTAKELEVFRLLLEKGARPELPLPGYGNTEMILQKNKKTYKGALPQKILKQMEEELAGQ